MSEKHDKVNQVAEAIRKSSKLIALTGAGISTNAGIPDFRGKKGLYTTGQYPPNVFDLDTFLHNPKIFYTYARDFVALDEKLEPTFAHQFLARLEEQGVLKHIVTQNIDGLHQKAGSRSVIEMHGGYQNSHCLSCGRQYDYPALKRKVEQDWVPHCDACNGVIKPDIVFFGEEVRDFGSAEELIKGSDVLLVIGTSLAVHPVAFLPDLAPGAVIAVNKGEIHLHHPRAIVAETDIDAFFRGVEEALRQGGDR